MRRSSRRAISRDTRKRQGLAQGHLRAGRFVQQRVELVADRRQLQPIEHRDQHVVIDGRHHQPPPTTASYSASGRSKAAGSDLDGSRAHRPFAANHTDKMRAVHNPLSSPPAKGMVGDDLARMADDHAAGQNHDLDALPDQAPGHRVAVRVEIDRAVGLNLAHQIPQLPERGAVGQRAKRPEPRRQSAPPAQRRWCRVHAGRRPRASTGPDAPRTPPSSRTGARQSRSS